MKNLCLKIQSCLASALFLITLCTVLSCNKKNIPTTTDKAEVQKMSKFSDSELDDDVIEESILSFYDKIKKIGEGGTSDEFLTLEDAEFLTEATYNYYLVKQGGNELETQSVEITSSVPYDAAIGLSLNDIGIAFYDIKTQLSLTYNAISYGDKALTLFDLEIEPQSGMAVFKVRASFISGGVVNVPTTLDINGMKVISGAANHAWRVWGSSDISVPAYTDQCDINITSKSVIPGSVLSNYPGAALALRGPGVFNYIMLFGAAIAQTQTCVDVVAISDPGGDLRTGPPSPYASIPGYANPGSDIQNTKLFTTSTGTISDPDRVFKEWLTTPMMNYYLSYLPYEIEQQRPSGLIFIFMHIYHRFDGQYSNFPYYTTWNHSLALMYARVISRHDTSGTGWATF